MSMADGAYIATMESQLTKCKEMLAATIEHLDNNPPEFHDMANRYYRERVNREHGALMDKLLALLAELE
jgi:hypothetical protein